MLRASLKVSFENLFYENDSRLSDEWKQENSPEKTQKWSDHIFLLENSGKFLDIYDLSFTKKTDNAAISKNIPAVDRAYMASLL